MQTVTEVEKIILDLVTPLQDTEIITLDQAFDRILGQDIFSPLDYPYWDNSAMDGYAVRFKDVVTASEDNPVSLKIIEEIPAGYCPQNTLNQGECARIFTGGMLPQGADTIVIQENTKRDGDTVLILASPSEKDFVRHKGSFYRGGDTLLEKGRRIKSPEMAILATAQCVNVSVMRSPLIAILSTGDELITPHQTLQPGQIIDSNQYLLASFIEENGGIPLPLGIIPDDEIALEKAISQALEKADWVISTGGVSVGDYDYVDRVITKLGGKIVIKSVKMKPGKPLTVATFGDKLYFGIPGNPVSTMVTCWRLLKTALDKLSGNINYTPPSIVHGITRNHLRSDGKRETYLWGNVILKDGYYQFTTAHGSYSSGNLINLKGVNGLAIIPVGTNLIEIGDDVEILLVSY